MTGSAPLDLESLRCFVEAARAPSFRVAARACALSPAAFGERISRLEAELGVALFQRTTRRVTLTPAGERLLPQAERALEAAAGCRIAVQDDTPLPFELTVGTRYELGLSWLVPMLGKLERTRPERRVHLYFGETPDLLPRVLHGELSCLITSARVTLAGFDFARLHEEEYVLVAKGALVAQRRFREPADARSHLLLDTLPDLPLFRYFLDARPAGEAWQFQAVQCLGSIAAVRARALEGAGICVLPRYFVAEDLRARRLVRLLPKTRLPSDWFRLVWRAKHPHERELQALAQELADLPLR